MSDSNSPLMPHGGYEKLRSYKVAEAVYDATVVFCDRFVDKRSRTHDQMVQAARSGVRNISEGSGAAATSRKCEMLLTNVARASLSDELLKDYKSFLVQHGLRVWPKDSPEALAMRERLRHEVAPDLPELAANAMLCAVNQAAYLLRRQVEQQGRDFVEQGGFTERLYAARTKAQAEKEPAAPACPVCGKKMRKRTAGKGPHAGRSFWGCSGYPECKGTLKIENLPDGSDSSDKLK